MIIKSREWLAAMLKAFPDRAEFCAMTGCLPENVEIVEAWVGGANVVTLSFKNIQIADPSFVGDSYRYTIKPPTILVNGIEVPKPMTVDELKAMPCDGVVHAVCTTSDSGVIFCGSESYHARNAARRGYLHRTEAAARVHAETLFGKENVR